MLNSILHFSHWTSLSVMVSVLKGYLDCRSEFKVHVLKGPFVFRVKNVKNLRKNIGNIITQSYSSLPVVTLSGHLKAKAHTKLPRNQKVTKINRFGM